MQIPINPPKKKVWKEVRIFGKKKILSDGNGKKKGWKKEFTSIKKEKSSKIKRVRGYKIKEIYWAPEINIGDTQKFECKSQCPQKNIIPYGQKKKTFKILQNWKVVQTRNKSWDYSYWRCSCYNN